MKFALFVLIGVTFLLCGLSPQLRTRYHALPMVRRVHRRAWMFGGRRWMMRVEFARLA